MLKTVVVAMDGTMFAIVVLPSTWSMTVAFLRSRSKTFVSLYGDVDQLADYSFRYAELIGAQDAAGVDALEAEAEEAQTRTNRDFAEYGLTECAKGS